MRRCNSFDWPNDGRARLTTVESFIKTVRNLRFSRPARRVQELLATHRIDFKKILSILR